MSVPEQDDRQDEQEAPPVRDAAPRLAALLSAAGRPPEPDEAVTARLWQAVARRVGPQGGPGGGGAAAGRVARPRPSGGADSAWWAMGGMLAAAAFILVGPVVSDALPGAVDHPSSMVDGTCVGRPGGHRPKRGCRFDGDDTEAVMGEGTDGGAASASDMERSRSARREAATASVGDARPGDAPRWQGASSPGVGGRGGRTGIRDDEEAVYLERVRAAVSRRPSVALRLARDHDRRFPAGLLGEEAQVLAIEALVRMGRRDEALEAARRHGAAHPTSALRERVRRLVGDDVRIGADGDIQGSR